MHSRHRAHPPPFSRAPPRLDGTHGDQPGCPAGRPIDRGKPHPAPPALDDLDALRRGDQRAFSVFVRRMQPSMMRVAMLYVRSTAVAEEAVQEAWLGVLRGLNAFEGRSSLRRWVLSIVANCARSRGSREARYVLASSLRDGADGFAAENHELKGRESRPAQQASLRHTWADEQLVRAETCWLARQAMTALPQRQREVILLHDLEGLDSSEVCERLSVSEANQRVLLHRARSKVRAALELREAA